MTIELLPHAQPFRVNTARSVPTHLRKAANTLVSDLLKKGVIVKVSISRPTDWCSPGFFVPKPDGKSVRLVTDFTKLNKHVKRPVHPFPSTNQILQQIPVPASAKYYAKLDAKHGYFQMSLEETSSFLTTFLLASGRYRYARGPMGLASSSDEWCRRSDEILEGIDFAMKIVDDLLVWASTQEELDLRIEEILRRCRRLNITLSYEKFDMGEHIEFAGHVISHGRIMPDPKQTDAITKFPAPKDVHQGYGKPTGKLHPRLVTDH